MNYSKQAGNTKAEHFLLILVEGRHTPFITLPNLLSSAEYGKKLNEIQTFPAKVMCSYTVPVLLSLQVYSFVKDYQHQELKIVFDTLLGYDFCYSSNNNTLLPGRSVY